MRKAISVDRVNQRAPAHGSSIRGSRGASLSRLPIPARKGSMTPLAGASAKQMSTSGRTYSKVGVTKEPRPATKAFHERSIRELFDFLIANNYQHPLTSKQLNRPSSSDFRKIFEFLVSFLNKGFKLGPKMEEEIPAQLKLYGYPFPLPKSHFQTIGVPHTWPTVLNVLTWLRVNIQASTPGALQDVLLFASEDGSGIADQRKMMCDYVNETYDLYMAGADEFGDALISLENKIESNSHFDSEIESLAKERDKNREILDKLMSQPDELSKLQNHLESIQTESTKFKRYQLTMEAHLKDLSDQLTQLSVDDAEQAAKLETLESELQSRVRVLSNQKDAGVNFPHLWDKLSALRHRLPILEKENQDIEAEIHRNELELEQDNEQVRILIKDYNRIRIEVIPERDDLEMRFEMTEGERLHIRFQWRELHGKLSEKSEKLEEELMREKMKEDDCEEAIKDLQRTEASVMNAASQLVEQIREKKEGHQRKTQQLRSRIEARKGRRDLQQSDVLDAKKKRAEEVAALRAMDAMASKEEEEMRDILEQAVRFVEGGTWKEQDALQKFFKDAGETIKKMKY